MGILMPLANSAPPLPPMSLAKLRLWLLELSCVRAVIFNVVTLFFLYLCLRFVI